MTAYIRPDGTLGETVGVVESVAPGAMRVVVVPLADTKIEVAAGATYLASDGSLQTSVPVAIAENANPYLASDGTLQAPVPVMMDDEE